MSNPYQKYQESSVQTATPIQLIVMLYDGALRFTRQANDDVDRRNYESANRNYCKAQAIVHELIASLNQDVEISGQLLRIYDYVLHLLIQANMRKDQKPALEAMEHLQQLRESWRQLAKQGNLQISMPSAVNR